MSRRADAIRRIGGWLVRGALIALWALVGWGTLLLLATVMGTLRDGPATAFGRLLPGPDAGPWGHLNAAAAALAVVAWLVLSGLWIQARREGAPRPDDVEGPAGD